MKTVPGNDGSGFVEVLVGRSSSPEDYQVLLATSTFMSPADSKAWTNTSRVRIFGKEKFSKGVSDQKWDRVKIVCTQPFNKTEKYGLSFVRFSSPPDTSAEGNTSSEPVSGGGKQPMKIGGFFLREETKDLPSGSLFFRKDETKVSPIAATTMAARARMATAAALKDDQSDSAEKGADQSGLSISSKTRVESRKKSPPPTHSPSHVTTPKTASKKKASDREPRGTPPAKKTKVADENTSFTQTMNGVIFALSGFKNPFRGELREKAMEMGAKYEPDWNPKCTHLVCAFPNTPKFNQVKAKQGLIVTKNWILDSYIKKRRLPARKYRLSAGDGGDSSEEDEYYDKREAEIFREKRKEADSQTATAKHKPAGPQRNRPVVEGVAGGVVKEEEEEYPYGGSTDEESDMEAEVVKAKPLPPEESSECDTEDEIQRVKLQQNEKENDDYGGTTEEDSDKEEPCTTVCATAQGPRSLTALPCLFAKCQFLLYGNFSPGDRRLVTRYITAYDGHIEEYMNEKVTHVITQEKWDENFDQALSENSSLSFVHPKWIFICHQKQLCVPLQPYIVVPT